MLNVLLESNAARTRRVGGTLTSAALHGALIAAAVTLTVSPPIRRPADPIETVTTIFHPAPISPVDPAPTTATQAPRQTTDSWAPPAMKFVDAKTPVVDVTPS